MVTNKDTLATGSHVDTNNEARVADSHGDANNEPRADSHDNTDELLATEPVLGNENNATAAAPTTNESVPTVADQTHTNEHGGVATINTATATAAAADDVAGAEATANDRAVAHAVVDDLDVDEAIDEYIAETQARLLTLIIEEEQWEAALNRLTTTAAISISYIAQRMHMNPDVPYFDRLKFYFGILFRISEDGWREFINDSGHTLLVMGVSGHPHTSHITPEAVYLSPVPVYGDMAVDEVCAAIKKHEDDFHIAFTPLLKLAKEAGIAAARADGALDDYLPAIQAMIKGNPHPDLKVVKHILTDYFNEPFQAIRDRVLEKCFDPVVYNYALYTLPTYLFHQDEEAEVYHAFEVTEIIKREP